MKILVTNDDGINADGLWALVEELKKVVDVVVVAPDREQSAVGTAITLTQPLRVQRVRPAIPDIETYAVEGTPGDCVILALEKLARNKIGMVVSGINQGLNVGNDVLISGTVSAALQGYLRGFPSLAVSISPMESTHLDDAAKVSALLVEKVATGKIPTDVFLNVNLPNLPLAKIKGIKLTRLAGESHIDTVEEGHDGKRQFYWLVRKRLRTGNDKTTDTWTLDQGNISITPLHIYQDHEHQPGITDSFCSELFQELKQKAD